MSILKQLFPTSSCGCKSKRKNYKKRLQRRSQTQKRGLRGGYQYNTLSQHQHQHPHPEILTHQKKSHRRNKKSHHKRSHRQTLN